MVETIPQLVLANADRLGDDAALLQRAGREWRTTTWREYGSLVRSAARALIACGIEKGDRVAILSYNTPEWVILDVAAMAVGAVPVGIYFGSSAVQVADLLERTEARVVLAQTAAHLDKIEPVRHRHLDCVIGVEAAPDGVLSWEGFINSGHPSFDREVDARLARLEPDDPATMIFTAAGHGRAMGVVLTHDNLAAAAESSIEVSGASRSESALSYLPLSHIAEQIFTILAPARAGYRVAFAQSVGRIRVDLPEIRPSIFFGVPLVWNGFAEAIRKEIGALQGPRRRVARWSMAVTRRYVARLDAGRKPGATATIAHRIGEWLFARRVLAAVGLDRCTIAYSGAAAASTETLSLFADLGLSIRQVWGLSEATGPAAVTRRGAERHGTVGAPMPGVEIALAGDDEILVRGRTVFHGYLDDPDATEAALEDGWLHTGDVGERGPDGLLSIVGRKKDIVITAGGKNVCPRAFEVLLEAEEAILDAVVVGDGRDQLGVLVFVDGVPEMGVAERLELARGAVDRVNERFARTEQIRKVGLLPRRLSTAEGDRDSDGRLRRPVVLERFAGCVEDLYS